MLGPQCTENPPTLNSSCGSGNLQEIGGLKAYVTGDQNSKLGILLVSDVHGFEAPKLRKLADKVAASGFLVVVPDFFYGNPFGPGDTLQEWLPGHRPEKGAEDAKKVIAELKSRGVSEVGAAGFCWGGVTAALLAKYSDCIQAAVLLHPGPISVEEINEVKVPIAMLGAETDQYLPSEKLRQLGAILSAKSEVDSYVKIYPGVSHGWTTRYDENDEFVVKSAEEAHSDMLNWLTKYIKS